MWAVRVLGRGALSLGEIAALIGGPSECTLRNWGARWRADRLEPQVLGRRPRVLSPPDRAAALEVLRGVPGGVGRDTLCAQLPEAPVRALRDLHRAWCRAAGRRGSVLCGQLRWRTAGRVLGLDLTDVPAGALGTSITKLLCARDLGTDYVPDPEPLRDKSAAEVVPALERLFERCGAPLVVKLDNEGTFRGRAMRAALRERGVVALFSPPYYPQYNGAAEAGIGAQKRRTERLAAAAGRPGEWALEDVLAACRLHNELARPWGARGPSPRAHHDEREEITAQDRRVFRNTVAAALREARRRSATIPAEQTSGRRVRTSALKRSAIANALVDLGHLEIRRRRVTPHFSRRKTAIIT